MKYLRIFENFDNRDVIISEIETITHILQDEYHEATIKKGESNSISINVRISNLQEIRNASYNAKIQDENDFISDIDGDNENFDYLSDLDLDYDIIDRIMELDEMVEFENRIADIYLKYNYKCDILYLNDGVTFYIHQ